MIPPRQFSRLVTAVVLSTALLALGGCTGVTAERADARQVPDRATASVTHPHAPTIDDRDYRHFTLANGLSVLVVSDPEVDKAAAALNVGVGSMADPEDREGLAHFLEHMLFLGTEKYPSPDEYGEYISRHGGQHNAYTAQDHTNYFFEIAASHLHGGLDRFAQFFVAPLFDAAYVEREMNAVHSEYRLQAREDGWRSFMAQKVAMNPEHPGSRFNIGSLDTLAERPEAPIREALLEFYAQHYSADRMGLVVLGREDVDTLREWATEMFSEVPRREFVAASEPEIPLYRETDLPSLLQIQPIRELRTLQLSFPLPPLDPVYEYAPGNYLANLIGHEGEGSLHAWLRDRGWINALAAGASHYGRLNAVMNISVSLTESGLEHWEEVAGAVFAYLAIVRAEGVDADRFREQADLDRLAFDYREKGGSAGYVRSLAANLLVYPAIDVIRGPSAMNRFDPDLIRDYLDLLRPERALVTLTAPEVDTDAREPWFDVPYSVASLPSGILERWQQPLRRTGLTLPEPNPFVPENLTLLADTNGLPTRIDGAAPMEVWHLADASFGAPRATLRFDLRTPGVDSAHGRVLATLYGRLLTDALNSYAYPARLAGLSYQLSGTANGLNLSLGGFDDKLEVLLDVVLDTMTTLELRPERFEHYQRELLRDLRNSLQQRPYQRIMGELSRLLETPGFSTEALLEAVAEVNLADLETWMHEALEAPGVLALIHGNVDAERAERLALRVRDTLGGVAPGVGTQRQLVRLERQPVHRLVATDHNDGALARYVQGRDQSWSERARFGLLGHMLSNPFFNDLRTERQLGYVVSAGTSVRVNTPGLFFVVQSGVAPPAEIERVTLEFLEGYRGRLARMSADEFEVERAGLLARLLEREQNLNARGSRLWRDLQDEIRTFDSREQLASAIRELTLDAFRDFYDDFLELAVTRSASTWALGSFEATKASPTGDAIDDVEAFKSARGSFTLPRPATEASN